ncbi:hypothetical protein POM88_019406 [Heracleum sosnowskyi]|uniref:Peptidase A1 domain-containing protein n=1 Tax=Heracleum sosnowskyi TaxID=360622 RepID=A0AAD8IAV3_9APIA|nr:hypothetical protein POM88_019406 [Heracleum sosnowskyi]
MITTNSLFVMTLWLILLCVATSTPSANANTTNKNPNTLSFKLLHRSTIPLFENEKFQQFLENNKQLSLQDSEFYTSNHLFQATTAYVYFVNLSIGEPLVPQYLAVDTGSSMVWIDANLRNKRYYYKPRFSSTYNIVNCSSPECSLNKIFICYFKTISVFIKIPTVMILTTHLVGLERFGFSDGYLDQVLFGVATETWGLVVGSPNFNRMLGLGPQPSSLLRSFSRKNFTYCIDDIFKSSSRLSFLQLGDIEDWDYGDNNVRS